MARARQSPQQWAHGSSDYGIRYRDPNRDRDRNRRKSNEFYPDSDSDFDFDCTDVL
jgi:hypothetical protein